MPEGGEASYGAIFIWAEDEKQARRRADAHMVAAEVTEIEIVDAWERSSEETAAHRKG